MSRESRDVPESGGRPEAAYRIVDEPSGLIAHIVVDDTTLGPAFGGIRFRPYASDREAARDAAGLARQMTLKCALAELPGGGAKGVVRSDRLTDRARACEVLGDFIESLGGRFRAAGDLGATADDLRGMRSRTAHVADVGLTGDLGDASAVGLVAAMHAVAKRLGRDDVSELSVAVQGLGSLGGALARRLAEAGARVTIADTDPDAVARVCDVARVEEIDPAEVIHTEVDVLAPCASGGVIDAQIAQTLRCRAIVGGANQILCDAEAGRILWSRRVLYAPDFLVNAGAVIRGAWQMLRGFPGRVDEIERIGARVDRVFEESFARDVPPEEVAEGHAWERLNGAR